MIPMEVGAHQKEDWTLPLNTLQGSGPQLGTLTSTTLPCISPPPHPTLLLVTSPHFRVWEGGF